MFKKIFFVCFIFCLTVTANDRDNASVEHKSGNINQYLNEISSEQEEKTQILEHILDKSYGTYLDLGTGGDSISYLLKNIPSDLPVTLIGSDIDATILNAIKRRHSDIIPFLENDDDCSLQCKLLRMDATNMMTVEDSSLEGISASALTHEIFSYVPTKSSLDQFFIELIRVLKKDGIFVYRDPKWDDNPEQDCLVILKEKLAKFFAVLFIPRFLDRKFTQRKDYQSQCIKPVLYNDSHFRINYFNKGLNKTKKAKLEEFINVPVTDIDFSRNISIEAPRGFISEIQRHFILFLKNVFITEIVDKNFFDRQLINIENLPSEQKIIFKSFLQLKNINGAVIDTSLDVFQNILNEKKCFYSFIENGLWCTITNKEKAHKFCHYLYSQGINKNVVFIQDDKLWADAKIVTLLFQDYESSLYEFIDRSKLSLPTKVLEWMKREGEEYYFYKTTDELITYVGQLTKYYLKGTDKDGYLLCPINSSYIKTVSRNLYKEIVDVHTTVIDIDGNKEDIIFDKNIIHFKLMKLEDAKKVYQDIIRQNKHSYLKLSEWISHELR